MYIIILTGNHYNKIMIYEEKVPFRLGFGIIALFAINAIYMFVLAYLQITSGPIGTKPAPTWFFIVFGALFISLTWLMSQFISLSIRIEEKTVLLAYGLFKVQINRDNIEKAYRDTANPLLSYGGWGFRFGAFQGKPRKVLNIPGYKCVVIAQKNTKQEIVFSTAYPDDVIRYLGSSQT
jgi:hypothetical protein